MNGLTTWMVLQAHAGLFSTSEELAVLVQLLIDKGTYGGVRMFSEAVADTFTARQPPLDRRGLGGLTLNH